MANTTMGKIFMAFNALLDTKPAEAIGLRRFVEKATYQGAYTGVNLAKKASRVFGGGGKGKKRSVPPTNKAQTSSTST